MSLRTLRRGATALTLAGATTLGYASLVERRWYRLRVRRVPGVARGLVRVLHVSDLHFDPRQDHKRRFVAGLADLEYDLVAITGDVLGAWEAEDAAVELLGGLTAGRPKGARPGVIVLGSNDIYAPIPKTPLSYFRKERRHIDGPRLETKRLVAGLEDRGYAQLDGRREVLDTPSGPVAVGGLPDPHLPSTVLPRADVVAPLDGDAVARVGLVHAPYTTALDLLISAGYPLLLAGHTHGGQVRVPGYGALVGNCDLPLDQIRGLSRYRDAWLHVSPGLGTSRYAPVRFACRPEATLLELLP